MFPAYELREGTRGEADMAHVNIGRKSGFIMRAGRMRRETLWLGSAAADSSIGTAATAVLLTSLNAAALAIRPFTVVRTRGLIYMSTDNLGASELQGVSYGHAVVSDQESAIGVTAVPTPATDFTSDLWLMYETLFSAWGLVTSGGGVSGVARELDSKAMRKVEDGSDLISVVETTAAGTTAGLVFRHQFRTLVKLH